MSNIQKLQGVIEPNKNQFCIKLYRKTYVIPTYSKTLVAKDLLKIKQVLKGLHDSAQVSTDFSSLTNKNDLKK
ncbi:3140_t:CDS:1, partial [Cetraspora pellucida]